MTDGGSRQPVYSETDLGQEGQGPWRYRVLSEEDARNELRNLANVELHFGGSIDSVSMQPAKWYCSQDRRVTGSFELPNGLWTFTAIFDGHAGYHIADLANEVLPVQIQKALSELYERTRGRPTVDEVSFMLQDCITSFDDSLRDELLELFPGQANNISKLPKEQIERMLESLDNTQTVVNSIRGSTAVLALVDPGFHNVWVANLGDSFATMVSVGREGSYFGQTITETHNSSNPDEMDRIRAEHPGEDECIFNERVVGTLAVTRALGDVLLKVPSAWTSEVYMKTCSLLGPRSRMEQFAQRIHTPPYISNLAHVVHVQLTDADKYLILASDGLSDFFHGITLDQASRYWIEGMATDHWEGPMSLRILRHALGGDDLDAISKWLTLERWDDTWLDDTTITVLRLSAEQ